MKTLYHFTFPDGTKKEFIEEQVALAILNAESAFGKPAVRLATSYYVAEGLPECLLEASTPVGEHIAKVFTGLLIADLGEENFKVELVEAQSPVTHKWRADIRKVML